MKFDIKEVDEKELDVITLANSMGFYCKSECRDYVSFDFKFKGWWNLFLSVEHNRYSMYIIGDKAKIFNKHAKCLIILKYVEAKYGKSFEVEFKDE